ncbi:MAG: hypothetical protein UT11_C0067G0006 [Berkelbacteria bacterium GW2011_GWA2_38_9]|uniref:PIN domain-containing protein n=1 Tax=Berkelbacteria bacterium GW2011_GWA2_38_9 TaxID=1618334 RepID=A0A0G0NKZ6_9BACT|nr:MAG: hypothetical protein UT11_C0067G0006 [Berkelbacteria bacterium GW2011_GWA2_38_9]
MRQIIVDTNILLDYILVREPFYSKFKPIFEKSESGQVNIIVILPVFLELEWVLRSVYKIDRVALAGYLQGLIDSFSVEQEPVLQESITIYQDHGNISLTDAVILSIKNNKYPEMEFLTNDRNLQKLIK